MIMLLTGVVREVVRMVMSEVAAAAILVAVTTNMAVMVITGQVSAYVKAFGRFAV